MPDSSGIKHQFVSFLTSDSNLKLEMHSNSSRTCRVTGFYFYGARFYDPAIGRFISEDSLSGSITSPLSLNRYSYVEDNPESFNDPSGNMLAYPFGGQAYSIHPVAPVPSPTPPPAPSQPATPPPSTPASPSNPNYGNSVTTQSASQGPGYWNWLEQNQHLMLDLIVTAAGDVATIINPLLDGTFRTIASHLVSFSGAFYNDVSNLYQLFAQGKLEGAANQLASFAWVLTTALVARATWEQDFLIGLGLASVGLGDVGSDGEASAVLVTLGFFQMATDLGLFFTETLSEYNSLYPNS